MYRRILYWLIQYTLFSVYFPVFIAFSGNGQSVYDAWNGISQEIDILTKLFWDKKHYYRKHIRSCFIDHWEGVKEVKIQFYYFIIQIECKASLLHLATKKNSNLCRK